MGNIGTPEREIILVPVPEPADAPVKEPSPQIPVREKEPAKEPA